MTDTYLVSGDELAALVRAAARGGAAKARATAEADARAGVVRRSGPAAVAQMRALTHAHPADDDDAKWAEFEQDMDRLAGLT